MKVYNLASSYGTIRNKNEIKLFYENSKIIIQYHPNDLSENVDLDYNKTYSKMNIMTFMRAKTFN